MKKAIQIVYKRDKKTGTWYVYNEKGMIEKKPDF